MSPHKLRSTLSILLMLVTSSVLWAQNDFDFYLQNARKRLAEGDCVRAEKNYKVYYILTSKTNKDVERQIKECKENTNHADDMVISVEGVSFVMKPVEGGTFWMGAQSADSQKQNYDEDAFDEYESPVHSVTVSTFFIGETEVTQRLWYAVMGNNPSLFKGEDHPVESIVWDEIQSFINRLNQLTGKQFRLPTEAEWEYAARGGKHSKGYKYSGSNNISEVAWVDGGYGTHPVKQKSPNELGVYDMTGNVGETCGDWFSIYSSDSQVNPQITTPGNSKKRVTRGGGWGNSEGYCRVTGRNERTPNKRHNGNGFRLALSEE